MSERNTQITRESLSCVLADYFNDVKLMLERKQYWPTPDYVMILLTRVTEATKQQREEMLEMQKALEAYLRSNHALWQAINEIESGSESMTRFYHDMALIFTSSATIREKVADKGMIAQLAKTIQHLAYRWLELADDTKTKNTEKQEESK